MKRRVMAMILLCVMAFSLVSCGGSSGGANAFVGSWKVESMSAEGMEFGKEMLDSLGMGDWTLDITADNKVTMNIMGQSETIDGKMDGDKLTVTQDGESISFVIQDGKLVWDMGEAGKVTFTK